MSNSINSQEATRILTENGLDFNISKRALYDGQGNQSSYFGLWNDKSCNCAASQGRKMTLLSVKILHTLLIRIRNSLTAFGLLGSGGRAPC